MATALCGAGVLGACGGGGGGEEAESSPAPLAPVVAPGSWVVIGSSSAAGAGAPDGKSWVALLQSDYASRSVAIVNLAIGGSTTYEGLPVSSARAQGRPAPNPAGNIDAALAQGPKLVLISYPSNDTALGYSADETVQNILAIRTAALSAGTAVVVLSTQPRALLPAQLAVLPVIDTRLSTAVSPCFVEVRAVLAAVDGTLDPRYDSGDGVHPNEAGHALIHDSVRSLLDAGHCVQTVQP